jgi:signal transduction histidine kinase
MTTASTSIRRKLMVGIMSTSLVVLIFTCAVFIVYEILSYRKGLVQAVQTRADILAANSAASLAFQNQKDASEVLATLQSDPRILAACLYDQMDHLFARYPASASPELFPNPPEKTGHYFESDGFIVFAPIDRDNRWYGTVYLKFSLSGLKERYRFYGFMVWIVTVIGILVAYALSTRLQKRIAGPVLELSDMARRVTDEKDYSLRAIKRTDDEIGLLTESFNSMLNEIQRAQREIQQLNNDLEQRVIKRTAELEAANKELEAFSYSVSHDLRAPLRGIDGFSRSLLEDYGSQLDDEAKRQLGRIRIGSQRMALLIDDLLKLSRINRLEIRREPVDLTSIARQIAAELRQAEPNRVVSFEITDGMVVTGDTNLLRIVVDNLLRNSWKYTSKHATAKVEFGKFERDGEIVYFVRDDGAGFDMAHANMLFVPFQRLHRQSDFEGIGVGLATVQRIIRRHEGRIWAEGAVEKGTTIYFTI